MNFNGLCYAEFVIFEWFVIFDMLFVKIVTSWINLYEDLVKFIVCEVHELKYRYKWLATGEFYFMYLMSRQLIETLISFHLSF